MTRTRLYAIVLMTGAMLHGQTGTAVPGAENLDLVVARALTKWQVPGAAIAVTKDGRLVYARGFGVVDVEANRPVQPDSLFRTGSISKSFTATAILQLVQQGMLDLDSKAFDILTDLRPPSGSAADPRIRDITVRHLLQHAAGWDREISGDWLMVPPFPQIAAEAFGLPSPPESETILRWIAGRSLDFDPGSRQAYSNIGYAVLGRIVEKVTGERYETYVRNNVLAPSGVYRALLIGDRAEGEAAYYTWPGDPASVPSVYPGRPPGPAQYVGGYAESFDAAGAWVASAMDLVRFAVALDRPTNPLLNPETQRLAIEAPDRRQWIAPSAWFGAGGWTVQPDGARFYLIKDGGLPGSRAFLLKHTGGVCWAVLFNSGAVAYTDPFLGQVVNEINPAVMSIKSWPDSDLLEQYYSDDSPRIAATGIQNSASYMPGPIAPGEVVSIFGSRLNGSDVRVLFGDAPGQILKAKEHELIVVVPDAVAGTPEARVRIERDGKSSEPVTIPVAAAVPGVFTRNNTGRGQSAAWNEDGSENSESNPAAPGSVIAISVTGLGPASVADVSVRLGSATAEAVEVGPFLRVRVPADAPVGAQVPLTILAGNRASRLGVGIAIGAVKSDGAADSTSKRGARR